ncbi:hypothetical protein [Crossiella sp. NPDC003009]
MLFVPASQRAARLPRLACGQGSGLGFGAGVVLTGVVVLTAADPVLSLVLAVLVVAAVSAVTTVPGALLVAAQGWGLHIGFVTGHFGELAFDEHAQWAGALLLAVAVLASAAGAVLRMARTAPGLSARASPAPGRAAGPSPARS